MKNERGIKLLATIGLLVLVGLATAFSDGPVPAMTGAPGESNCTECHDEFGEETNLGGGLISIAHVPRYELGQPVTITVEVNQAGQSRWGFQLTALTTDTNQPVGRFVITDPVHTQVIEGQNGRSYVEHTETGTYPGSPMGAKWTFDWIAPEADLGPVAFYAAGNAANNNGDRLGDWIYTTLSTISPPSYPAATLFTPNGDEVLGVGETVSICWDATANADFFDILFFPFPGALPDTVVSGLPKTARGYQWKVPNNVAESARIAVLTFNNFGFGIDESDKTFLIVNKSPLLVQVVEPNDTRTVQGGTTLPIRWTVDSKLNLSRQQLRLSLDGGKTFPVILPQSLSTQTRSFDWQVPTNLETTKARILVLVRTADGNLIADAGDADFSISKP